VIVIALFAVESVRYRRRGDGEAAVQDVASGSTRGQEDGRVAGR
jgi:hypothetical protein